MVILRRQLTTAAIRTLGVLPVTQCDSEGAKKKGAPVVGAPLRKEESSELELAVTP